MHNNNTYLKRLEKLQVIYYTYISSNFPQFMRVTGTKETYMQLLRVAETFYTRGIVPLHYNGKAVLLPCIEEVCRGL